MKRHMDTHKEKNRYLCDVGKCNYTRGEIDLLESHKRTHMKKWSEIVALLDLTSTQKSQIDPTIEIFPVDKIKNL